MGRNKIKEMVDCDCQDNDQDKEKIMKRVIATKNMKGTDGYKEEHTMNHQGFTSGYPLVQRAVPNTRFEHGRPDHDHKDVECGG